MLPQVFVKISGGIKLEYVYEGIKCMCVFASVCVGGEVMCGYINCM